MGFPLPNWLNNHKYNQELQDRLRTRFLIKTAALLYSPSGKLEELARGLGVSYGYLVQTYAIGAKPMNPELALKIEKLLDDNTITREMLRPDLFLR